MGLHQTKKLCTAKETAKQKATCGMGENIDKSYIQWGVNIQNK